MQAISMRVILKAVFGLEEGFRYQELARMLGSLLNQMSNRLTVSLLYFPILRRDLAREALPGPAEIDSSGR